MPLVHPNSTSLGLDKALHGARGAMSTSPHRSPYVLKLLILALLPQKLRDTSSLVQRHNDFVVKDRARERFWDASHLNDHYSVCTYNVIA